MRKLKLQLMLPTLMLMLLGPWKGAHAVLTPGCGMDPNCHIFSQSYYGRMGMYNPYMPQGQGELIVTSGVTTPGASPFHPYLHDQFFYQDSQYNFKSRFFDGGPVSRDEYVRLTSGI